MARRIALRARRRRPPSRVLAVGAVAFLASLLGFTLMMSIIFYNALVMYGWLHL